jgi:hypothetical protein
VRRFYSSRSSIISSISRNWRQGARYERGSIVLTSNKSYTDWGSIFSDPIIATAILDRLLHHSTTVNIRGESFRLKERRRAGLLSRPEDHREERPTVGAADAASSRRKDKQSGR